MKHLFKNAVYGFILANLYFFVAISGLNAQPLVTQQGDITAGGGLTLTTGFTGGAGGEIGINGNGYYAITDEIRAGLGISIFFGDFSPTQINIDGHYIFRNEDNLVLYGLVGIGYWRWSFNFGPPLGTISTTTSGLNLGGGVEYVLDNIILFAEPKLNTIGGTPFVVTGGVRFRF